MKPSYKSYLQAYSNFAQSILENSLSIMTLSKYASLLTFKANELMLRAELNNIVDLEKMRSEIFESGKLYVRILAIKLREQEMVKTNKASKAIINTLLDYSNSTSKEAEC